MTPRMTSRERETSNQKAHVTARDSFAGFWVQGLQPHVLPWETITCTCVIPMNTSSGSPTPTLSA